MKDLGVLVPIVTPCSPAGEIDIEGTQAVCQEMLDTGNSSIFVMGSTGRGPWFSREDRVAVCSVVADWIGPDVPLYAGCLANGIKDMVNHAAALKDAGAQFAVITAPGYFKYDSKEIENILFQFADKSPLPVLLYDIPVFTGAKLDIDSILWLMQHENIVGLKDSSADFSRFKEMLSIMKKFKDKFLLQGKEHLLAESLEAGASGLVSTFSHFHPRPFVALFEASRNGDYELVHLLQEKITRMYELVVQCYEKQPQISTLFHIVNITLRHRGTCKNIMLEHETDCPQWLEAEALGVIDICNEANDIISNWEKK